VIGSGSLNLIGNSAAFSGATTIGSDKILGVNNNLGGNVYVNGVLHGNGTIGGDVTLMNDGIVAPGNSIGNLHVQGNFITSSTSSLQIEINAASNHPVPGTNNDVVSVAGIANLTQGGNVDVIATPGNYTSGLKYYFLESASPIQGTFSGVYSNLISLHAQLGYNEFSNGDYWAYFTLVPNDPNYGQFAQTQNQGAVANYLEQVFSGASGDFQTVLNALDTLGSHPSAVSAAYDSMNAQVSPTLASVGLQNTTLVMQQLAGQLRSGVLPSGTTSYTTVSNTNASSTPISLASGDGKTPAKTMLVELDEYQDYARWRGWSFGYGLGGSASADGNAAGLNYGMAGTLIGTDLSDDEGGRLGLFGGYQGTSLRLTGPTQTSSINGGMFGGYMHQENGFLYYSAIAGAQFNDYKTQRIIQFGSINRTALGSFGGGQGYGYLEGGASFPTTRSTLQPYVALQYIYLQQNGYTETGADSLNQQVNNLDTNSFRSLLGTRWLFAQGIEAGRRLSPELRALWLHEYLDSQASVNSVFAPVGGGSFAVQGVNLGRDWAILGGGLRWQLAGGWNIYGNYDTQVNTRQVFHVGSCGLEFVW